MNIFKKIILKFIFIIIIDIVLLITASNYIRSQQSASNIVDKISNGITFSNGNYVVSSAAKKLIDKDNLLIKIVVKKNSMLINLKK